jgi:CdiI immunity protein
MRHDKGEMKFPALRAFMRSYLHQDFSEEYGSAVGAAKAFRDDATTEEVAAVVKEWREFLLVARGKALDEVNALLAGKLGSAWRVGSLAEIDGMSEALEK